MQTTPSGGRSSASVTEHLKHNRKAVIGFGVGFGCLLRRLDTFKICHNFRVLIANSVVAGRNPAMRASILFDVFSFEFEGLREHSLVAAAAGSGV